MAEPTSPNERLKLARQKFFTSAADAAKALGVPLGTYAGHENGHRGFPASRAPAYARRFKVTEEWLLFGKGERDAPDPSPSEDALERMIREVIESEITVSTLIADLPRIVAPALREQLVRYQAEHGLRRSLAASSAHEAAAQSPVPTIEGGPEGLHTT